MRASTLPLVDAVHWQGSCPSAHAWRAWQRGDLWCCSLVAWHPWGARLGMGLISTWCLLGEVDAAMGVMASVGSWQRSMTPGDHPIVASGTSFQKKVRIYTPKGRSGVGGYVEDHHR